MRQPNILWICTDQQRWDTLSCRGHKGAVTPHIDALAASGVLFDRAYCQSTVCTPSRTSFLTGTYPIANQVQRNGNDLFPDHHRLVTRMFEEAGYHTGLIGKLHLSRANGITEKRPAEDGYKEFYWSHHPDPDWEEGHDYHRWLEQKGVDAHAIYDSSRSIGPGVPADVHQTTWAGERARSFVERSRDKPWFLSINLFDPHPPFDPPAEYLARFNARDMPAPAFKPGDIAHQRSLEAVDHQSREPFDPRLGDPDSELCIAAPLEVKTEGNHDTPPQVYNAKFIRACYQAMIAQIDDMVGMLVETLRETGQLEDTLVIFMSDHGEMLGDHGLLFKGCRFYEGLVHIPLILSWPRRFIRGAVSPALVELVDIAPTLLEAASLPVPAHIQGKSLLPMLTGSAPLAEHKAYVLSEYFDALLYKGSRGSRASMYFDGRYKLSVYHDAGLGELFDLVADPQEFEDHWNDPAYGDLKCQLLNRHFNAMMNVSGIGPSRSSSY